MIAPSSLVATYTLDVSSEASPSARGALDVTRHELPHGTQVGDRYRLEGVIGRGGMGVVYAARDVASGQRVAIKFMTWGAEAERADRESRFMSEVRNANAVRHRHVVHVIDLGFHADEPYLVMEHLAGESLEERLQRKRVLSPAETLALLLPIASALASLHEQGILHRDVKPSNIFLAEEGGEVVPKLLDFGVSRAVSATRLTHAGVVIGTPMYMAPEQASGGDATTASEVWSLAVVAYECLTGGGPYRSCEPQVLATLVLAGRVLPLAARYPSLPQQLCKAVERGLWREPGQRCASMDGFGAALVAAALHDGVALPGTAQALELPRYAAWLGSARGDSTRLRPPLEPSATVPTPVPSRTRRAWPLQGAILAAAAISALAVGLSVQRGGVTARSEPRAQEVPRPAPPPPTVQSLAPPAPGHAEGPAKAARAAPRSPQPPKLRAIQTVRARAAVSPEAASTTVQQAPVRTPEAPARVRPRTTPAAQGVRSWALETRWE